MARYNKAERTAAVQAWQNVSQQAGMNHESARREVCGEFAIDSDTLDKWIAEYDAALDAFEPNSSLDLSHLNALELRLSHERERLRAARTPREKAFRAQQVASCEREIAGERAFLSERGVDLSVDDAVASLSDDELLAELEPNAPSKLEWIKGTGVDGDGHNLTWWKNKAAKGPRNVHDRMTVFIQVRCWDHTGASTRDRSQFEPSGLKEAKAWAKEFIERTGGSCEVEGRVTIPYQTGVTIPLGEWKNTASNGYYVWAVNRETYVPVSRRGPFRDPDEAIALAKQSVKSGQTYDEVVTFGGDPEASDFSIWKSFKAWSGEVHYSSDLPKVGGRLKEYR